MRPQDIELEEWEQANQTAAYTALLGSEDGRKSVQAIKEMLAVVPPEIAIRNFILATQEAHPKTWLQQINLYNVMWNAMLYIHRTQFLS